MENKKYEPLFTLDSLKDIHLVHASLDKMYEDAKNSYEKSVSGREERLKFKVDQNKGHLTQSISSSVEMLNKKTDLMYSIIKKYVKYAKAYNRKFKEVKDQLLSSDHKLVEIAIQGLLDATKGDPKNNYWEISETYKKMVSIKRYWKVDQQLFDVSKKCFAAAQNNRQVLLKARKYLFKTHNQINGFRKLSNAMKFKWGSAF